MKVIKKTRADGCDCWGRPEYEDYYVVENKDGKIIYTSKYDPTDLIKEIENNRIVIKEENNMLSACEANKKTLNNIKKCVTEELSKINEQINQAISNGKFSISNDGYLQPETTQRLQELGYKITTGNQYNESYYCISWK